MPTYLYECDHCGRFEEFQRITEEPLKDCPKCNASVKRIIGAPGIIFKGSGFYSTDSKSSSNTIPGSEKKEKKEESSTNNKDSNKEEKVS